MPILPLLPAFLLYHLLRRTHGAMEAFVRASVGWGVLLLAVTELLSLRGLVSGAGVAVVWGAVAGGLGIATWRTRHAARAPAGRLALPAWVLLPVLAILAATAVVALVAPPNSTDALTYHLARVAQWAQQRSVRAYATSVTRQIFMPSWSEFLILHWRILGGGSDRLAAMAEWLAFAGCLVLGGGLARRLGADAFGLGLAVVFIATLPTAIVEASSTQTDLVLTFWSAALAWFALGGADRRWWRDAVPAGAALGLAAASKGTAYVVCAPLVALLVLRRRRLCGSRAAVRHAAAVGGVALLLVLPSYARNFRTFDHPLGPALARGDLGNASHGIGALASNILRNATIHLRTPMRAWNAGVERTVTSLHTWAGLDVEDSLTTYPGERFEVSPLSTYEGRMGNPLHFILLGCTAVLLCLGPSRGDQRAYGLAVLAGAILFCWAFRWQHWHGRLHTPFFVLAAPLAEAVLAPRLERWRAVPALALLLGLASAPWVFANQMRPLVGLRDTRLTYATPSILSADREREYFGADITDVYLRVIADLARAGCAEVGLVGGEETRVYPLFPFARARGLDLRLHYVFVQNETTALEERPPVCALFVAEEQPDGWRPGPPYDALVLRWTEGRFALWDRPS